MQTTWLSADMMVGVREGNDGLFGGDTQVHLRLGGSDYGTERDSMQGCGCRRGCFTGDMALACVRGYVPPKRT